MADGSVVIGVQLDTAAFAASAVQLENQIMSLGTRLNASLTASLAGAGVGDGMAGVFMGITAAASSLAQNLSNIMRTAAADAISGFTGAGWASAGSTAVSSLGDGVRAGSGKVTGAVRETASQAKNAFDTDWGGIGSGMMSGIASGIRAAGAQVIAAIEEVSRQTEGAVKAHFKINSPSVVMRDEVGVMISRGIAEGITGGAGFIREAADSVYSGTRERLTPVQNGGSVTQNIYLRDSDTSPYQTARRIKRESEAALRL